MKLGTGHPFYVVLRPMLEKLGFDCESPLGIEIDAWPISPEYTRKEEKSLHLLLKWWSQMDERITVDLETLKTQVLIAHFGAVKRTGLHGQEDFIPLRRTTSEWDSDLKRYKRKKLSVEGYAEVIDYIYRSAAEDGIVLPDLDPEKAE